MYQMYATYIIYVNLDMHQSANSINTTYMYYS